ncbi:MAG: TraV family lipoprotein [Campylobacterota bacterium]|nr:TraV family lipoprotein [Campylobacterota bacterium]
MKKSHFTAGLLALLLLSGCSSHEAPKPIEKKLDATSSKAELEAFLNKYDQENIKAEKKAALTQDSDRREIAQGLPPRTPDLFASGLFMPYDDDHGIYHNYDHIFFKIKDGKWDLDSSAENQHRGGFVFTKEEGYK